MRGTRKIIGLCLCVIAGADNVWAQQPTITEYPLPTFHAVPGRITQGSDGNLWFTETIANKIARITTNGTITEYPVPTANSEPQGIATGPDGALWFTEYSGNKIGRITTSGSITEYAIPLSGASPRGITAGPDGNLWFTESLNGRKIGRITTSGRITEFVVPGGSPFAITQGPLDSLWFSEFDKIGRITTSGEITEYPIPLSNPPPSGIILGPDGNLWYASDHGIGRISTSGSVVEFPIPGGAQGIVLGPDGNFWFTTFGSIGRASATGAFATYPVSSPNAAPVGLVLGPDGNIWFTEASANNVGKLDMSTAPRFTPLTLSESSLAFTGVYGGNPPLSQSFTLTAATPTSFTTSGVAPGSWLNFSPSGSLTTDQTITVHADQKNHAVGSYSETIVLRGGGATHAVQVKLTVTPSTGNEVYTVPSALDYFYTIGGQADLYVCLVDQQPAIERNFRTLYRRPFCVLTGRQRLAHTDHIRG